MTDLLSVSADAKTRKGESQGYLTGVMYMIPYKTDQDKANVCAMAHLAKCHEPCLVSAGRGAMSNVYTARMERRRVWLEERDDFWAKLEVEILRLSDKARKNSLTPVVRLNGTSDIPFETMKLNKHGDTIFDIFPDLTFYDYTKIAKRDSKVKDISNYSLTWSFSTDPRYLKHGIPEHMNWAVVFGCDMPETFLGREVVDGDKDDLRFLDPSGVVVGLKAKGRARKPTPDNKLTVFDVPYIEKLVKDKGMLP
jgi:hypothetical protein